MVFSMYNVTGNCIYGIFYVQRYRKPYFWYFLYMYNVTGNLVFLVFSMYNVTGNLLTSLPIL